MSIAPEKLKHIVEAALLAAARPLNLDQLLSLFEQNEQPGKAELRTALKALADDFSERSVELKEVASGWRVQVRAEYAQWTSRLWEERPTRYSRALLETLALMAYRQPITRGEIEDVRGVSVSTNIIKTMLDRNWIRIVGHRDVPGRPAMFGTTRDFLDYFGLKSLDELPTLAELRDIDSINVELDFDGPQTASADNASADNTAADTLPEEAANYDTQENTESTEEADYPNRSDEERFGEENPSEEHNGQNTAQGGYADDENDAFENREVEFESGEDEGRDGVSFNDMVNGPANSPTNSEETPAGERKPDEKDENKTDREPGVSEQDDTLKASQ